MTDKKQLGRLAVFVGALLLLSACDRPPVGTIQRGFRGDGQEQIYNPRVYQAKYEELEIPEAAPPADADGPRAREVFQNVQVLGDLSSTQMVRVMTSMATWVTGGEGCNYCHNLENPAEDSKYPKIVARRMLQMVRYINSHWGKHVGSTGVTCYTCHRGNPVPANEWFDNPRSTPTSVVTGWHEQQNSTFPSYTQDSERLASAALGALPPDPFTAYLKGDDNIRVQATAALPPGGDPGASIQKTEWTYALMITMGKSLGVNCDYCHNTNSFQSWAESSPQRVTAWYGIRMVRALNNRFLNTVADVLPPNRHGPMGDGPKLYCATCHQGVFKPMYGYKMLKDFPELAGDASQDSDYLRWKAPWVPLKAEDVPAGAGALAANFEGKPGVRVFFDTGKSDLAPDFNDQVQNLLTYLKVNPDAKVAVSGFTDSTGNKDVNAQLAKSRAVAVASALSSAGIPESRIVLQKPADTTGDGPLAEARRVEAKAI